jgi:Mannosyltransferase (PIG-V)
MRHTSHRWRLPAPDRWSLAHVVAALVLTRFLLYVASAIAIRMVPTAPNLRVQMFLGRNASLAAWVRWDAGWYISIVERGYWFDPKGESNAAFFPLFPLLIKGFALIVGNPIVAGLLVANLAAVGAVLALWRWVRAVHGPVAAGHAVLWLLVYPFSLFFHTIYAEGLFFLLVTLALDASARGHRLVAGVCGALAAATRPMGVLLTPALAWGLWRSVRTSGRLHASDVVGVLLPAAGLAAYMAYLWVAVGDPWAFWKAHVVGWGVQPQWAVASYWREPFWVLTRFTELHNYTYLLQALRALLPIVLIILTVVVFRRLDGVAGVYASLATAVSLCFAPESVGREFLAVPPAFAALGLVGPRGLIGEAVRLTSMGVLLLLLFAFVTGRFIG